MKKRILPALLALCMVMSLLPVAFAAEQTCGCKDTAHSGTPCAEKYDDKDGATMCTTCTNASHNKEGGSQGGGDQPTPPVEYTCACQTHGKDGAAGTCTEKVAKEGTLCATCTTNKHSTVKPAVEKTCACMKHGEDGDEACGKKFTTNGDETLCPSCRASAACNPCDKKGENGCTLAKGHPGKHTGTACTSDAKCPASKHGNSCPLQCKDVASNACTLTQGHSSKHEGETCTKDSRCPATTHTKPVYDAATDGNKTENGCPLFKACPVCTKLTGSGSTWSPVAAGHDGKHDNEKCLGYNGGTVKGKCGAGDGNHIAGCPDYVCECAHKDDPNCTHKAGCPVCAADDCDCPDCRANPGMGAVVDENGNPVDPTEPTEPEAPKAEDFTDMEDWMAADVQVALDKGWLEGNGDGTFNGRGVTKGTTIAAALARMDGETITGADWDKDALAWAEDQDVFEGIDLTGDSMARKDLVLVIWRMAGKPAAEKELDFTDVDGLEGDHLTAMQWAVENGIVKGNGDGTVTPDGSVNRAALCTMLARYDSLEK